VQGTLYFRRSNMLDILRENISFFVYTVLVMRFRDFGFYISEPANLHAVKSRAIAARISPFILLSNVLSLRQGRGILSKEFKPELFRHLISCIRCQAHGSEIGYV